jgi:hypothetical protein
MAVILDLNGTLPQTFTAGNWPLTAFNTAKWRFVWTPTNAKTHASWSTGASTFFSMFSSSNGQGGLWIVNDGANNLSVDLYADAGGSIIVSRVITWTAGQAITITVDMAGGQLTIAGAATGDGTYGFTRVDSFSAGTLGVGRWGGGGFDLPASTISDVDDAASGYTITAEIGAVAVAGTAAGTLHGHRLDAEPGSVAIAGTNATLIPPGDVLTAEPGAVSVGGRDASFFLGTILPKRRGATAPAAGLSTTSPASTEVGDMVMVVTWERGGAGVPTHTLQANFIEIRSHGHDDGSTDGRLSVAFKIATVAGAQSYQAYTSSVGTETWTGCVVIRKNTFAVQGIVADSSTLTTNSIPNSPSVNLTTTRNYRMFSIAAWHHGSSATITPTSPTNYNNIIEVAGASTGEVAITDRELSSGASTEDPGAFNDNISPNGTVSMTIAIPNVLGTIIASASEVDIVGTWAALSYAPIGDNDYTIAADAGAVAITGTNASTLRGSEVAADPGTVAIASVDATLSRGFGVTAEAGSVAIAGTTAGLLATRRIVAESGALAITGTDAALRGLLEVGDHGIYQVNFGHAPASGSIELQTQVTGSSFLLLMGGNMNDIGDGPTDSETNTWRQISTSWQYVDAENNPWGVAAWRAINGTGDATSHTFTQGITVFDEITIFAVELKGAHYLVAHDRDEEANAGTPGTVGAEVEVTVPAAVGSAILVASWWGSGPVGQNHTATPDGSGWVQLEFYGTNDNDGYVQGGVWAKVVSPGTHTVQFTHSPAQGSKAWLMAFAPMPSLPAEVGAVTVAGTDATLAKSRSVAAESGSFAIAGTEADFVRGVAIVADGGALALTGTDVSLAYARIFAAESGAIALTGTNAGTLFGREVSADAGGVTVAGTDAVTRVGRLVTAEAGTTTIAGTDATLKVGCAVQAEAGAVTLTGVDASLAFGYRVAADAGATSISGTAASTLVGYRLAADVGAVVVAAPEAALVYDDASSSSIVAEAGAVAISGTDAGAAAARRITAEVGAAAIAGADASTLATRRASADPGSLVIGGSDASLVFGRRVSSDAGAIEVNGTVATLVAARRVVAQLGTVAIGTPETVLVWSASAATLPDNARVLVVDEPKAIREVGGRFAIVVTGEALQVIERS